MSGKSGEVLLDLMLAAAAAVGKVETLDRTRFAVGTQEIVVSASAQADDTCTREGSLAFLPLKPPPNGSLTYRAGRRFMQFKAGSATQKACAGKRVETIDVYYAAREGFQGIEEFQYAIVFPDRTVRHYKAKVTVW